MNTLTQPGAPPERIRLRLTLRLTVRVIMVPHYYALQCIRQAWKSLLTASRRCRSLQTRRRRVQPAADSTITEAMIMQLVLLVVVLLSVLLTVLIGEQGVRDVSE